MGAREGRRARHSVRTVILQFGKQSGMYGPMSGVGFVGSLLMFPPYAAWLTPTSFGFVR